MERDNTGRLSPTRKFKILVVDDNPPVQRLLKERLERLGYQVMQALVWNRAIDLVIGDRPDLIIMDLELDHRPGEINGVDVTMFVKKSREYPAPIIIYSAHTEQVEKALEVGASLFVPKTAPVEMLMHAVKAVLSKNGADPPVPAAS